MKNRQTVLEVSRQAFLKNIDVIREKVGQEVEIMPVVKASAYGTYLNKDISLMNKFNIVAVALVDEALELRKIGYKKDILVLNQPCIEEIEDIVSNNINVGVSSFEFVKEILKRNVKIKIHIELETGMGRCGVDYNDLDEFLNLINSDKILVQGVYTHLSSPDTDYEFTNKQIKLFNKMVDKVKSFYSDVKYIHCSASNAILNFDLGLCNMVRPGIIMYGYPSSKSIIDKIKLKPVAKLRSKIIFIKEVDEGYSVSYGRSFVSNKRIKIATVAMGYADGVKRCLSNKGFVSINGKRCPIIGKICMDSFMVDVSGVNVHIGDLVYLFDNNVIMLEEVARICDTINYEILSTIGNRVPRIFID